MHNGSLLGWFHIRTFRWCITDDNLVSHQKKNVDISFQWQPKQNHNLLGSTLIAEPNRLWSNQQAFQSSLSCFIRISIPDCILS